MGKTLLIVESPNKAKTMRHYVDPSFTIEASYGHIRDLPKEYGVDLTTFEEQYEVREDRAKQRVSILKKVAREHDRVILLTDPDREGEGIAWHLCQVLGLDTRTTDRIELREINKVSLQKALQNPGRLNLDRVGAQRARRVLDRIVGYDVSGEICRPANASSAGRVQSAALHILCELERKILSFVSETYWTISADYKEGFSAFVAASDDASAESEGDDEFSKEDTSGADAEGRLKRKTFRDKAEMESVLAEAQSNPHVVRDVASERVLKSAPSPYDTAECMADAGRKLKLGAKQIAQLLQSLFEAGYITYHRTDSTRVAPEAVEMARAYIQQHHPKALPGKSGGNAGKGGAQDAHEAIRPTKLTGDGSPPAGAADLYAMIKARFLASQCKPAEFDRTRISVRAGTVELVADGSVLLDPGYLVYWGPFAKQEDEVLPKVTAQQSLAVTQCKSNEKKTRPPSRYDSTALTKKLKASGLGRPSTYASIVETLLARGYAENVKNGRKVVMQPTDLGMRVDDMLTECFPDLVSEVYTADMESRLEDIESGSLTRVDYLRAWHADFRAKMKDALVAAAEYRRRNNIVSRSSGSAGEETETLCDRCGKGNYVKVPRKQGKGHFLACPSCRMTRDVTANVKKGACKKCGSNLIERLGRDKRPFFGCVRFGAEESPCDYIESTSKYLRAELDMTCPACKKHKVVQFTPKDPKEGSVFKACGDPERDKSKRCKYIESEGGKYQRSETGTKCPGCKKHKLVLLTPRDPKDGRPFKACSDPSRKCKFIMSADAAVRDEPCPDCGRPVVEKFRRQTPEEKKKQKPSSFWSCTGYPKCQHSANKD